MKTQEDHRSANRMLTVLSVVTVLLVITPMIFGRYGYFIDEFYYIACSKRLALGYVDHPPLAPWLLRIITTIFGDSLIAIRLLPALAGGACVFLTGMLARRLGASCYGQILAALCMMLAPIPLLFFGFFSMNPFEILLWVLATGVLVELVVRDDDRLWLLFGLVAGIGLLNKHTFALIAFGLGVGVVLTPMRRCLINKRLWFGVLIAAIVVLPNVYWQWQNGWPSLEFYRNADLYKNVVTPPLEVLKNQVLFMNPMTVLVWGAGVIFFLVTKAGRPFRFLGWMFVTLFVATLIAQKSRPDRIVGAFPIMFAGGATLWDSIRTNSHWRWTVWVIPSLIVLSFLPLAPLSFPLLPPEALAVYAQQTGIVPKIERGAGKATQLPQWFADRFGWEEFVENVADVVGELTPAERDSALILTPSYGHAGAIELFGREYDLPSVCSGQNTYYLWGPVKSEVEVLISVGFGPQTLGDFFDEVHEVARTQCDYCPAWRDNMSIYIARNPKRSWGEGWVRFKHFE